MSAAGINAAEEQGGAGGSVCPKPNQLQNPTALPSATNKDGTSSSLDLHTLLPLNPWDQEKGEYKSWQPRDPPVQRSQEQESSNLRLQISPAVHREAAAPPPRSASHWGPPKQPHIHPYSHPTVPGGQSPGEGLCPNCSALPWTTFPAFHGGDLSWPAAPALPLHPSQWTHSQHSFQAFTPSAVVIYAL